MIYLDHNATTPLLPEVGDAMAACYRDVYGNPSSQHATGRKARRRLDEALDVVSQLLSVPVDGPRANRMILTSGGTESNNLAILGLAALLPKGRAVISAIEHPSVAEAAANLARLGWDVVRASVTQQGVVDLAQLEPLLAPPTRIVSVMLANNETGVLQPVAEIAARCRAAGIAIHTDAVQVVGKLPVDFTALGVDALSLSAHKFHGPPGVGLLIVRHGISLAPLMHGGRQQDSARPGTEPLALAVGLATALSCWSRDTEARLERWRSMQRQLEHVLQAADPTAVFQGADARRLPHTVCVSFPGLDRQSLMMALDLVGVASSTGSACASGASEPSPTLIAMGRPRAEIDSAIRLSFGATTTEGELIEASERISSVLKRLRHA